MKLRSNRVLKRGIPQINSSVENQDSSDGRRLPLSSNKSNSGKKGDSEAEVGACVDKCDENLEKGMKEDLNTDDKGLFLGSEVLNPVKDLGFIYPKEEIEEESVERVQSVEGNGWKSVNVSETDSGSREEIKSPHHDYENGPGNLESNIFVDGTMVVSDDDDDKETLLNDREDANHMGKCKGKKENSVVAVDGGRRMVVLGLKQGSEILLNDCENANHLGKCKGKKEDRVVPVDDGRPMVVLGLRKVDETLLNDHKNANHLGKHKGKKENIKHGRKMKNVGNLKIDGVSDLNDDDSECELISLKDKRGRKRENMDSECNRDKRAKKEKLEKNGIRVRERVLRSRSMTTVSGGVAAVDGGGRMMVLGLKHVDETPKKLERRGRPPKVQTEDGNTRPKKKLKRRGRPRKLQGEITPLPILIKDESLIDIPMKTLTRRGRPPKVSHEIPAGPTKSQGIQQKLYRKDMIFKKLKRRGRPLKMEARTSTTRVIKMRSVKLVAVKKNPKIQKKDGLSEAPRVKIEESSEQIMVEGEAHNAGKEIDRKKMNRRALKQMVRDKISNILLKSGWTVDFRQREDRLKNYVYTEPNGLKHWSTTAAYAKLKKKIENGDADCNEISAFTPIPEEEISMLFRHHDNEHHENNKKNKKKNKKIVKNITRGKIVIDKKKQPGKKSKVGSKRKMIFKQGGNGIITKSREPSLLARGCDKGLKQENGGLLVNKKRNLLSWMIDSGVILPGCKVQYGKTRRQKRLCEGTITNEGICCGCCNEFMGLSEFAGHYGGKSSQCFDEIYLDSETCLRKCLFESWRKEEELNVNRFNGIDVQGDDPNDDTCNICGDGGNLICCDGCPSTFHQSCLDIQNFPSGDWNCIYCSCKFCGVVSVITPQVEDPHDEINSQMFSCCLCEERFHHCCLQEVVDINIDSDRLPFCGRKCQQLFERLQTYIGVKHELDDGFSWTLLQRSDISQDATVHDTQLKVENNSKLAVAFSLMDECFMPIVDDRSGTNIIHSVVYNCRSNFKRLNCAGFLTAVLEKGDEFISAASIRIHGYRLAEMPFIGTRHMYRRQGMCRRLLDAIESTLSSLGVEELIIPAIPTLLQTWTKVFGFTPLEESKKQAMTCMSLMVFPGIDVLNKPLLQNQSADMDHSPFAVINAIDYKEQLSDAERAGKDVLEYEEEEKTTDLMDVCCCPESNDENNSQFETTSTIATDYKQTLADTAGVGEAAIDNEQTEEATVVENVLNASGVGKDVIEYEEEEKTTDLMDVCCCPEPNDENNSQFETTSTIATDYKQALADTAGVGEAANDNEQTEEATVVENVINASGVGKDVVEYEEEEKTTDLMDVCCCPEPTDENNSQFETTSTIATDYKQTLADTAGVGEAAIDNEQTEEATVVENVINASGVGKDVMDYKETEEQTVLMDSCSCPDLENDKLAISHGIDSLCDLTFDVRLCDTDGQTCVDTESFPACTIQPNSTDSVFCENHESLELKIEVENDGVPGVKIEPSPSTSKLVLKDTFDLNVHPAAIETDMHIISNDHVQCEPPVNLIPEPVKINIS